jgi:hypothetical protein
MSSLFDGYQEGKQLIHLPGRSPGEHMKMMVEQLTTWEPTPAGVKTKKKTDIVMALWFAEIRARELIGEGGNLFHQPNPYQSARDKRKSVTIDLDYMGQAALDQGSGTFYGF